MLNDSLTLCTVLGYVTDTSEHDNCILASQPNTIDTCNQAVRQLYNNGGLAADSPAWLLCLFTLLTLLMLVADFTS